MNKRIIHSVFESMAHTFPYHVAISYSDGTQLNYLQLNQQANRLAHLLKQLDVQKGTMVGVAIPSRSELVISLLATFKAGGIYLPVDLGYAPQRLIQIFTQCNPYIVITIPELKPQIEKLIQDHAINLSNLIVLGESVLLFNQHDQKFLPKAYAPLGQDNLPLQNDPDDSNYIFYTSGSTGQAKAILGCHDSLSHFIHWEMKEFGTGTQSRISQLTAPTFDASLRDMLVPLCSGGCLCIPEEKIKSNMGNLVDWLEKEEVNLIHTVPSLFRLITRELKQREEQQEKFKALKQVLLAGEMVYAKDLQQWQAQVGDHVEIVNLYGPTETTLVKTFHRIREIPESPAQIIHVGKPISNTQVAVINDEREVCMPGELGEVYIKTPFWTKGYYQNQALTQEVFVQNPLVNEREDLVYKTGDVGRYLPDGCIEILGRKDQQLKINGIRVELGEVQQAVLGLEGVQEALVIGDKTKDEQTMLICYYTGHKIAQNTLRESLAYHLNRELIPAYFVWLEAFPLNINGKIDKKALPKPLEVLSHQIHFEPVVNETEARLEKIWQELLGVERIGRKVSFFMIGGTSLKAIQVISRIYKQFEVLILVRDIFAHHTIEALAALIENAKNKAFQDIPPLEPRPYYDLSHAQKRLWVLEQFEENQTAYNMSDTFLMEGELDVKILEKVCKTLIERHESLRTVFCTVEGEPRQKILPVEQITFQLDLVNLRDDAHPQTKLEQYIDQETQTPFHLEKGPLFRAKLFRLRDQQYIFLYVIHHIISDRWSELILIDEVFTLLNAFHQGKENPLPPLKIQYKDFAAWQNQQLEASNIQTHQAYWLKEFEGGVPVLHVPTDFPRPPVRTSHGDIVTKLLDADTLDSLRALGEQQGASLFMVLLALVKTLLFRYTHQNDIVLGFPVAGRVHETLEGQIGLFVNNLAVHSRFSASDSFDQLLALVKNKVLGALEHQVYPFDKLVDDLNLERDTSRSPLFDVVVVLQNIEFVNNYAKDFAGLTFERYDNGFRKSMVDIRIVFIELDQGLSVNIEYNTDLFAKGRMERMLGHFEKMARSVLQDHRLALQQIPFIPHQEQQDLQVNFNNTHKVFPKDQTLHTLFEAQVAKTPEAIALQFDEKRLTYRALNEEANRMAFHLREKYQLKPDEIVALMVNRSERMIIALLGVLKAGAAYLPIDPTYPEQRKRFILQESSPRLLITESDYLWDIGDFSGELFALDVQFEDLPAHPDNLPYINQSTDLAYVIYTSGSTGQPKGVMIEHQSPINMSLDQICQFQIVSEDRILQFASLAFDASVSEIFMALCSGATLVLISKNTIQDPGQFLEYIEQQGVNVITFPPSYLSALDIQQLSCLKTIISAGEPANLKSALQFSQFGNFYNAYGPTECAVCVSIEKAVDLDHLSGTIPIGKPIANMEVHVLDEAMQPVPIGVEGEICVAGQGLARGYVNDVKLTASKFVPHPLKDTGRLYKTGDYGRWLPDGKLQFMGRKDEQVKIRGYRVEMDEVRNALLKLPAMKEAYLMARKDELGEKYLIAYVVNGQGLSGTAIKRELNRLIPDYMIPSHVIVLPQILLNHHGKVDTEALPLPQSARDSTEYVPPRNETESQLVGIWQQVLGNTRIGIEDSFFEIGGQSLKALQVIALIHQKMQVRLELNQLFLNPTIAGLSDVMAKSEKREFEKIPSLSSQTYYEVSHAQRRLWVLSQFEESKNAFNLSSAFEIHGALDVEAFQQAFCDLLSRHEILRTTFHWIDNDLKQQVHAPHVYAPDLIYISSHDPDSLDISDLLKREATTPFDLEKGPLVRGKLIQTEEARLAVIFTIHHILCDEWSMSVLIKDLITLYVNLQKGKADRINPLPIQYKDFAAWQNRQLAGDSMQAHQAYWGNEFREVPPFLELPYDYSRPEVKTYQGNSVSVNLSEQLTQDLNELSKKLHLSLFMTLLATVKVLLYRYSGQQDITVGYPSSGRNHVDLEDQIGLYLNTLALRTVLEKDESFLSLLGKVKDKVLKASEHQVYPFDKLVEDLGLSRDTGRSPLFDVMVILYEQARENQMPLQVEGMQIRECTPDPGVSRYDLSFVFRESRQGLQVNVEYNTNLFSEASATRLLGHYQQLVAKALAHPEQPIAQLDYLTEAEKENLTVHFNPKAIDFPEGHTIVHLFEQQVALHPEAPVLLYPSSTFSYAQLNARANKLAHFLKQQYAIAPQDHVAVMMNRSEIMVVTLLGIMKAGAAYVPIDTDYPKERVQYIVQDAAVKLLVTDQEEVELEHIPMISKDDWESIAACSEVNPATAHLATHPAYIMYTSGSTGKPKGVMVSHQSVVNLLSWMWNHYAFTREDIIFQNTPYVFDVSVWEIFMPLCFGGQLFVCEREVSYNPEQIVDYIRHYGTTVIHFVPSMLGLFLNALDESKCEKITNLKQVMASGEALRMEVVRQHYEKLKVPLHNIYGPTEATVYASHYTTHPEDTTVPIGKPTGNTKLYIVDENLNLVPEGVIGEIAIAGKGVAMGYVNRPELTAEKFVPNPFARDQKEYLYLTGDLGKWQSDGNISYRGRKDFQVKIRGYRIELGEIENALIKHPAIEDTVVAAYKGNDQLDQLVAYVVGDASLSTTRLRKYLTELLPAYMIPACFVQVDKMPLNANGKVDRSALPNPENYHLQSSTAYVAPANELEKYLEEIWQQVLGKKQVGTDDNFFEIGGNSLKLVMMHQKLTSKYPELKLTDLFKYTSIGAIAAYLTQTEDESLTIEGIEV